MYIALGCTIEGRMKSRKKLVEDQRRPALRVHRLRLGTIYKSILLLFCLVKEWQIMNATMQLRYSKCSVMIIAL